MWCPAQSWGAKAADAVECCGSALREALHAQGTLGRTGRMSQSERVMTAVLGVPWQLRAAAGFGAAGAQWGPSAPPGKHSPSLLSVVGTEGSSQSLVTLPGALVHELVWFLVCGYKLLVFWKLFPCGEEKEQLIRRPLQTFRVILYM